MACILLRPLEKGVAVVTVDVVVRMDDCLGGAVSAVLVVVDKGRYFDRYACQSAKIGHSWLSPL